MDTVTIIKYNKSRYVSIADIIANYKCLNINCKTSAQFIKRHDIDDDSWLYLRKVKNDFTETDGKSRKFDKVYIRYRFFENYLLPKVEEKREEEEMYDDIPNDIELEDSEKFRDNEGNIIDIHVVGERKNNKCYFSVASIKKGFGIKNLNITILDKKSCYENKKDYLYFNERNSCDGKTKKLYLTYIGLLRVLFASHKKTTANFIYWASETLFTVHMGTEKQRDKLAANLLATCPKNVKEVFRKTPISFPCIYLLSLGNAKHLRKTLNLSNDISDNVIIYKYGRTCDLKRRIGEHEKRYGKLKNVKINLECFAYIDPKYSSEAEKYISDYFDIMGTRIEHNKYNELVYIVNRKRLGQTIGAYEHIQQHYGGFVNEMILTIKNVEKEKELLKKELECVKELSKKDLELKDTKIENLLKELENMKEMHKKDLENMKEIYKKDFELRDQKLEMKDMKIKQLESKNKRLKKKLNK